MGRKIRLHICSNTIPLLSYFRDLGANMVNLDFVVSMNYAWAVLVPKQVLTGNIEPVKGLSEGAPDQIRRTLAHTE